MASNGILKQPQYITKKTEYKILLELIKRHKVAIAKGRGYNIQALANTLGLDPKTVRVWMHTPRVQLAIAEQMEFYLNKMQETGSDDWRQWQAQVELAQKINELNNKKTAVNQLNLMIVRNENEVRVIEEVD